MVTLEGQQSRLSEGDERDHEYFGRVQMPTETRVDLNPIGHNSQDEYERSTRLDIDAIQASPSSSYHSRIPTAPESSPPSPSYHVKEPTEYRSTTPPSFESYPSGSDNPTSTSYDWPAPNPNFPLKLPPLSLYDPEELEQLDRRFLSLYDNNRTPGLGSVLEASPCDDPKVVQTFNNGDVEVRDGSESGDDSTIFSDVEEEQVLSDRGWVADVPSTEHYQQESQVCTPGGLILPAGEAPSFGSVCVTKSNNVHMGNKMFYKNVTIKQFIYSNPGVDGDGKYTENGEATNVGENESNELNPEEATKDASRNSDLIAGVASGAKISNGSSHPLYMSPRDKVTQWLWTWRCAAIICAVSLILVSVTIISTIILVKGSNDSDYKISLGGAADPNDSSIGSEVVVAGVRFIERGDWLAQPAMAFIAKREGPAEYVIIGHTATDFCDTQIRCMKTVRYKQMYDIESRGWKDIGNNFLIGGDGLAYVGRGWDQIGKMAEGYDSKSINIMLIGTFKSYPPTDRQSHALKKLIEGGVENGKIAKNYTLIGESQVSSENAGSPGKIVYDMIIKVDSHWTENPEKP